MSMAPHRLRTHLARSIAVLALVLFFVSVFFVAKYEGISIRDLSHTEIRAVLVAAIEHIARERGVDTTALYYKTDFQGINRTTADDITERVLRLGHRLPIGWNTLLARVNSVSQQLPEDFFSSASAGISLTRRLRLPKSSIPDHNGECVISLPVVVDGNQELLGIVWYSFSNSEGGGTGVVVLSTIGEASGWTVVQETPLGVY